MYMTHVSFNNNNKHQHGTRHFMKRCSDCFVMVLYKLLSYLNKTEMRQDDETVLFITRFQV